MNWRNLFTFILIAGCFSAAVYKIDHNAIDRVAQAQLAAQQAQDKARANGAKIAGVCHSDLVAIAEAHKAIRSGFYLQSRIAADNISAIRRALKSGQIPANWHAYYHKSLHRQMHNHARFLSLAHQVKNVAPIC